MTKIIYKELKRNKNTGRRGKKKQIMGKRKIEFKKSNM